VKIETGLVAEKLVRDTITGSYVLLTAEKEIF
jgi:hypothetical protein